MLRTVDIILIGLMALAAAITFQIKFDAEKELDKVRRLEAEIRLEENTIDLLQADWSLANQPSRLQDLAEAYHEQLGLEIMDANQIVKPTELPAMVADLPSEDADDAASPDTATITGAVDR
jgi:hypothetical protein